MGISSLIRYRKITSISTLSSSSSGLIRQVEVHQVILKGKVSYRQLWYLIRGEKENHVKMLFGLLGARVPRAIKADTRK